MTTEGIFQRMVGALEAAGIPYMLTGSFASSYHGLPRATQDIDENAALDALGRQGQFNVIDLATGWKVDFIIRKARPFSRLEFERRSEIEFQGMNLVVATAEDVVIAKLEWAKFGQSQRQIEDVSGILKIRSGELDLEYISEWVGQLQLSEQWKEARRMAGIDERP